MVCILRTLLYICFMSMQGEVGIGETAGSRFSIPNAFKWVGKVLLAGAVAAEGLAVVTDTTSTELLSAGPGLMAVGAASYLVGKVTE